MAIDPKPQSKDLSATERAAVLLLALESEVPGVTNRIFSHMGEDKAKNLLRTISALGKVDGETISVVIEEFFQIAVEHQFVFGGEDISSKLLMDTFGIRQTPTFFSEQENLFRFVDKVPDSDIVQFLKSESRQMGALLFNFIAPERMADILSHLNSDVAKEITQLLLEIDIPNFQLLWDFQRGLEERLTRSNESNIGMEDDPQLLKMSRVIEMVSPELKQNVYSVLESSNPKMLEKLKGMIYTFRDFEQISDRDLETVLYEIPELKDLAIALRGASESFTERVNAHISDRVRIMLDEERSSLSDTTSTAEIESAQRAIVKVARQLESAQKISKLIRLEESAPESGSAANSVESELKSALAGIGVELPTEPITAKRGKTKKEENN